MFGLQDVFDKQLKRKLQFRDFILKIIKKKLLDLGVRLNQLQLKIIRNQLKVTDPTISFEITDKQIAHAKIKSQPELESAICLALTDISSVALEEIKRLDESLPDIMVGTAESVSKIIFRRLRKSYRYGLKERREVKANFEEDLYEIWGKAINQLEVLLGLAIEAAELIEGIVSRGESSYTEEKWIILSRLHARACQITGEIIALLKAGYADGAQARWRSLHEVAVVAAFIFEQDNNVTEQYLEHDVIEEYKSAVQQLNLWPDLKENRDFCLYLDELKVEKTELVRKYGRFFPEDYGWSANVLGGKRPTFREIEKMVNLTYFRPNYREASHNIHAGVRGAFSRLGLHPDCEDILLAGASDFGLASPGHLTAVSLMQATVSLLQGAELLDSLVVMKVIIKQGQTTGKEFWRTHRRLMRNIAQPSNSPDVNSPSPIFQTRDENNEVSNHR